VLKISFWNFFKKKEETRGLERNALSGFEALLIDENDVDINKETAMNIAAVRASVELISNTVASIPIYLYKGTEKVKDDFRVHLLNNETGDLFSAFDTKQQFLKDYLLNGNGYIFINRKRNKVKSLHYVDDSYISYDKSDDIIFKFATISVQSQSYNEFDFIKLLNNSDNGVTGSGICQLNQDLLKLAHYVFNFEKSLLKSGGAKKGFLKSSERLSEEAMRNLKEEWDNLYQKTTKRVAVLNKGLDFEELSNNSVELQLSETKKNISEQIYNIFNIPSAMFDKVSETAKQYFIQYCIIPIVNKLESAINKVLLLENEKEQFRFMFDTRKILRGDIQKQFEAYNIALQANFMQLDEVRKELDLPPLNFNYIKLGLQDVLLDAKTQNIYTANTNQFVNLKNKGSDKDDNGNTE